MPKEILLVSDEQLGDNSYSSFLVKNGFSVTVRNLYGPAMGASNGHKFDLILFESPIVTASAQELFKIEKQIKIRSNYELFASRFIASELRNTYSPNNNTYSAIILDAAHKNASLKTHFLYLGVNSILYRDEINPASLTQIINSFPSQSNTPSFKDN